VNQAGQFFFYNEQFEKLVKERLHIKPFPSTIFKLTSNHKQSNDRLQNLLTELWKKENLNLSKLSSEKIKKISLKLTKVIVSASNLDNNEN